MKKSNHDTNISIFITSILCNYIKYKVIFIIYSYIFGIYVCKCMKYNLHTFIARGKSMWVLFLFSDKKLLKIWTLPFCALWTVCLLCVCSPCLWLCLPVSMIIPSKIHLQIALKFPLPLALFIIFPFIFCMITNISNISQSILCLV